MKRNPERTQEEIANRHRKAVDLWQDRVMNRWLQTIDRIRDEQPRTFAQLICHGVLGIPFGDSDVVALRSYMDDYKGEKSGSQRAFQYLAELILRRIDEQPLLPDTPYVTLASWIEFDADLPIDRFSWVEYGVDSHAFRGTVGKLDLYISHVRWAFFDAAAESLNWSAMKAARMAYRGIPLFERDSESGEFSPFADDAEDYVYLRQKGKRQDVTTGHELPDWATRYYVKADHIAMHDAIFFSDWDLSPKELELRQSLLTSQCGTTSGRTNRTAWPWGNHETELLKKLASAAREWWSTYDPEDATTAPTSDQVAKWLESQDVAKRVAEVMVQILRADGLSTGPRK